MTDPGLTGYQDWKRTRPYQALQFVSTNFGPISTSQGFGPFYVGNTPYMFVQFGANKACECTLAYFNDQAMTVGTFSNDKLSFGLTGALGRYLCAPKNQWMQVSVNTTGTVNVTGSIFVYSAPGPSMATWGDVSPVGISVVNSPLGAGATAIDNSNLTHKGPAMWYVWCTAATWTADLQSFDASGGGANIASTGNGRTAPCMPVYLDGGAVRTKVVNTSGGAALYTSELVLSPILG